MLYSTLKEVMNDSNLTVFNMFGIDRSTAVLANKSFYEETSGTDLIFK